MSPDKIDYSNPNTGMPNPVLDPDLVDHDAQIAAQAEASRAAGKLGVTIPTDAEPAAEDAPPAE